MARYNIQGDQLAQGINCKVRVDMNDPNGSNPVVVGFVQSAQIRSSINVQRAEVIGELLPISLDPSGAQVSVTMKGFVPSKQLITEGIESVRGGGTLTVKSFNPNISKLVDTKLATKIPYLDLYDDKHKSIIGSTTWLIPTSYSDSSNGKGYIESDLSLEGIGYDNGSDYESVI